MSVLDRVAARQAQRARGEVVRGDPVTLEEFGYMLGRDRGGVRSKAGVTVGARRALGITAWYSGVRYLSESVAGLPWHVYRMDGLEKARRSKPSWLRKPDVEQPWYGLVEFLMMSLLHKGNSFNFKMRNAAGQVIGLREIHPDRVTTGVAPDGTKRFLVDRDELPYTTREVLHIPGLAYDGRVGLNPIQVFADSLGTIAAADDYAGRWFANGTHVGGIISVPQELKGPEAERLRAEWDRFHEGLVNAHRTGVLSKGATYSRVSLSASDAQLLETRQFGIDEVARMLRIPPHKLYELTRSTNNNIEHQSIEAITDSIQPWVERIEAWLNFDPDLLSVPGNFIEASLEGKLRGDSAARSGFYSRGILDGWMMPATAARLENQPAGPELEYYLRPLNMAVIRPGQPDPAPEVAPATAESTTTTE